MYTLTQFLSFAAAGALALSVASIPTRADEMAKNLGPVDGWWQARHRFLRAGWRQLRSPRRRVESERC